MTTVLAPEPLSRFWPEAEPLMRAHGREVEALADDEFDFDFSQAAELEKAGMLLIFTARLDLSIVGYCIWFLTRNILRAGQMIALQSAWYVKPELRDGTLGLQIFRRSLTELRNRGATEAFPHFWAKSNPKIAEFFARLGAKPTEFVYRMKL